MYSSKEYQSKCIRNTVSSLLVLARDIHTSEPCDRILCCTAKRRVDPFTGQLEGQQDSRLEQSPLPLSFTNLACQLGFITSSKLSPLPSFVPAANKEVFATIGRWARPVDLGRWCLSGSRNGCCICITWHWSKGALSKEAKEEASQGFSVRFHHLVSCAVHS